MDFGKATVLRKLEKSEADTSGTLRDSGSLYFHQPQNEARGRKSTNKLVTSRHGVEIAF